MTNTLTLEKLLSRRKDLATLVVRSNALAISKPRKAIQHRAFATVLCIRLDEIDHLIGCICHDFELAEDIPLDRPSILPFRPKRSLRYRYPGATTDIVSLIYDEPGIKIDALIATVHEKYRHQGTTRGTVIKLVRRLIREKYALQEGTKLFLTEICRNAWESSPLYHVSSLEQRAETDAFVVNEIPALRHQGRPSPSYDRQSIPAVAG